MSDFTPRELYEWCRIPTDELESHPRRKIPFRLVKDSTEMGLLMARELVDEIKTCNSKSKTLRIILPCGPMGWMKPFTELVNREEVSLKNLVVFHMDECLDWQGRPLPREHPLNFKTTMERYFYAPILPELSVPEENRNWLLPETMEAVGEKIWAAPVDLTYGGWGQDGHLAYNQARRNPYSRLSLEDLRGASIRIQENNPDTVIALAQRNFGTAYQFVPPMSVTLGVKECLSARKVRLWSDTGAWKQTALRVALFGPLTPEYPLTLLQEHPDALLTATIATATHPISEHPEWDLGI
jgi:glucosamine-6-phosphate deaminase